MFTLNLKAGKLHFLSFASFVLDGPFCLFVCLFLLLLFSFSRVKSIVRPSVSIYLSNNYSTSERWISEMVDSQRGAYPAGGTPLYKLYRYVPPGRVGYLRRFGLKTGIVLPILVWNRDWFSRELRECMNVFIVSILNE